MILLTCDTSDVQGKSCVSIRACESIVFRFTCLLHCRYRVATLQNHALLAYFEQCALALPAWPSLHAQSPSCPAPFKLHIVTILCIVYMLPSAMFSAVYIVYSISVHSFTACLS